MAEADYTEVIKTCEKEINALFSGKGWADDEKVTQLFAIYKEAIYQQVHTVLVPQKTEEAEKQIRDILAKNVIGYNDPRKKVSYIGSIRPIKAKIAQISSDKRARNELIARYIELYDGFMALASFRSFKHYCIFMQSCFGFTLWEDTQNIFEGYWYYAGQMVLDGSVKFLEKQLPTGFGKCALPSTLVRTPNGITTLENVKVGDTVYSMQNNELCAQRVKNKWYTHKKQVKITTRGGVEITVSPEHRLYTQKGYVQAQELSCSDYLYRLCKPIEQGIEQNQDEFEFATLMLFDGSCMTYRLTFTKEDNLIFQKFLSLCDKLKFEYRITQKQGNKAKEVHIKHNQGRPDAILAKYGILNCLSKDKKLSNIFLDLPIKQRYDFIGLMLATDGYIPIGKRITELAGITLASKDLIVGIQQLLNSCGIYSYFNHRTVIGKDKTFDAYSLNIANEYFDIIAENCYCYQKQDRIVERANRHKSLSMNCYCNNTNYPKEVVADCKEFRKLVNKQFSRNKTFKREIVERFAEHTGLLQDVVYKDFVWEQIKSVEFIDEETDMIDIEVEGTHNFIANDIVSHNSVSDAFLQSWIFGIDYDNDILKVCGNDKFTDDCFQNVTEKLMLSEKYGQVFPYYAQFKGERDLMFQFCSRKDLKFAITGSKKSTNLRIVTKLSDVNGVRAKYLFLDDITQRKDMSNLTQHQKDIHAFSHEWFERNYNRNQFYIVASGTTYSQFDLLSFLKRVMGGEEAKKSSRNKYTFVGKSDFIVPNGTSVFVCVPLLDYDTDESTYPKKISTASARKKREENPTEFWAMDMQRPLPPDNSPFYFTKLRQYTALPNIGEHNRLETCIGALDTKRRGKDYLSMPIFFEADDPDRKGESAFFLVDWLYDDRPMKNCIPLIVSKIIQHKITRLYVERNTEECIETLLTDKLREQGYTSCVIEEVYSTEPKDRRIMAAEGDIKSKMIFPQYGMYSVSNDIGKALMNFYGYTYVGQVAHDDAPDSLALFAKRFIMNSARRYAKISSFRR